VRRRVDASAAHTPGLTTPLCHPVTLSSLIAQFKFYYRRELMTMLFDWHDLAAEAKAAHVLQAAALLPGMAGMFFGREAHLLDAATMSKTAWDNVTPTHVVRAWAKTGLLPDKMSDIVVDNRSLRSAAIEIDTGIRRMARRLQ